MAYGDFKDLTRGTASDKYPGFAYSACGPFMKK